MKMKSDSNTAGLPSGGPANPVEYRGGLSFAPQLSDAEAGAYSVLALAHIGDGVYELMMRTALAQAGVTAAHQLHRETVRRVNAPAQAAAVESMLPMLTDAEWRNTTPPPGWRPSSAGSGSGERPGVSRSFSTPCTQ